MLIYETPFRNLHLEASGVRLEAEPVEEALKVAPVDVAQGVDDLDELELAAVASVVVEGHGWERKV